jgi:DNA modification methylase
MLGMHGRNRSNVWNYPCANSFSRSGDEGNLLASHPTVKPVAMIADAIMDATASRDIVLDGFLGSGNTLIAAERTGRRCFGLELDPLYVDGTVRRWQAFTRNSAHLASSGKSFAKLEVEEDVGKDEDSKKERTTVRGGIRQAARTLSLSERKVRKS